MKHFIIYLLALLPLGLMAQDKAIIYGTVIDEKTQEPAIVNVVIASTGKGTVTDIYGEYELEVPADKSFTITFSGVGYKDYEARIARIRAGRKRKLDLEMIPTATNIKEVEITGKQIDEAGMIRETVEAFKTIPTTTGNIESVLPQIALGTTSGTGGELSSQYSVRGGNYDENLVYVNDFEIYRPQLIRAGQQEGLTFPNIDLIRDLSFSSGGFESRFGDKLSSVLNVKYKRPTETAASLGMSFLGGSAHVEGSIKKDSVGLERFRYLVGARYKSTQYLLGTLDLEGEYTPNFADIQGYFTYDISKDLQLGYITNYNRSEYSFIPERRSTSFGLVDFALNLTSFFRGQEIDDFTTFMNGVSLVYIPDRKHNPYYLKLLASRTESEENERIDIIGDYFLSQIETGLGSNSFGDVVASLGSGTQHQFVRNYLNFSVTNIEHKGGIELEKFDPSFETTNTHFIQWGARYQREVIDDEINEWERLDSAGYSLPFNEEAVLVQNVFKSQNNLSSDRISGYIQDTWTYADSLKEMKATVGLRASYWSLNNELIWSPRAQFLYKPLKGKSDVSYRIAAGMYFQPAFYREMRRLDGTLNQNILAQKSAHVVMGGTWDFNIGNHPKKFRFIAEAYYKYLWDLISYDLDNVRIRYSGENDATGYVAGLDFRINGEFVPGAESWINLSFLRARENLTTVQHLKREIGSREGVPVNDVARPTDQLMQLSVFFQDYLPKNENFKMHLNFTVGTGWPFGIPENNDVYRNTYRFDPYHRVDIGFAAQLYDASWERKRDNHPLRFTKNTWLSLEVFNLMKVSNEASKTWIKAIDNTQFAIPNFLTSRRINLRLKMDF